SASSMVDRSGNSRSNSAAAANSWSLLPKYRITIDGSMLASAAIARMVARSKPDWANRSLAAAKITALVSAEDLRMPTSVCQRLLTRRKEPEHTYANKRWHNYPDGRKDIMNSTYDTDVLIVGAGPTGLTLAVSLVSRGISTTLVDRQAAGANTSR